jgi:hypothetical protein
MAADRSGSSSAVTRSTGSTRPSGSSPTGCWSCSWPVARPPTCSPRGSVASRAEASVRPDVRLGAALFGPDGDDEPDDVTIGGLGLIRTPDGSLVGVAEPDP